MIKIHKTHPKFKKLKLVLLALGESVESCYALNLIKVTPKTIVATDGKVLHILDWESGWKTGFYRVIKNDKNNIVLDIVLDAKKFPKWEDFVPQHTDFFELCAEKENEYRWSFSMKAAFVLARKGIFVNTAYLKTIETLNSQAKVFFGTFDKPVLVAAEDFRAIIMITTPPEVEIQKTLSPHETTAI